MSTQQKQTIDVMFRRVPSWPGYNILALFPNDVVDWKGNVNSYQIVGQHGAASYNYIMSISKPATVNESKDLYNELQNIYHDHTLRIVKKQDTVKYLESYNKI